MLAGRRRGRREEGLQEGQEGGRSQGTCVKSIRLDSFVVLILLSIQKKEKAAAKPKAKKEKKPAKVSRSPSKWLAACFPLTDRCSLLQAGTRKQPARAAKKN